MKLCTVRLTKGGVCSKPSNGFKYCDKHFFEYKKECRAYHVFYLNKFYDTCAILVAKEELILRKHFALKFDVRPDEKHLAWENFLKTFIEKNICSPSRCGHLHEDNLFPKLLGQLPRDSRLREDRDCQEKTSRRRQKNRNEYCPT